ncbi:GTP-binding protein that may be involved in cell development (By similarity), partial [Musa troglodytarum]
MLQTISVSPTCSPLYTLPISLSKSTLPLQCDGSLLRRHQLSHRGSQVAPSSTAPLQVELSMSLLQMWPPLQGRGRHKIQKCHRKSTLLAPQRYPARWLFSQNSRVRDTVTPKDICHRTLDRRCRRHPRHLFRSSDT